MRTHCLNYVCVCLSTWDRRDLKRHVGEVEDAIKKGLKDKASEGRVAARGCFGAFEVHFPRAAERLAAR